MNTTTPTPKLKDVSHESKVFIINLFARAGYTVALPDSAPDDHWQPFDFFAERDGAYLAVQVRTSQEPSGARVNSTTARHFRHIQIALDYPLPAHAQRVLWHHCLKYDTHKTYMYTPGKFVPMPNPLADLLPPPIPKKYAKRAVGRPRKYKPAQCCPLCKRPFNRYAKPKKTGIDLAKTSRYTDWANPDSLRHYK